MQLQLIFELILTNNKAAIDKDISILVIASNLNGGQALGHNF